MEKKKAQVQQQHDGKISSKGYYTRGYVPHLDDIKLLQFITFRLSDSLPQSVIQQYKEKLEATKEKEKIAKLRKKIDRFLDSGYGSCALAHPQMAEVMQNTFIKFDKQKYDLIAWCIMPNHVHVLIKPIIELPKIVRSWKSYTGKWAIQHNVTLKLGFQNEKFWNSDYWDRFIRDEEHLYTTIKYIHNNPVKAGLCKQKDEWQWSSAWVNKTSTTPPTQHSG